MAGRTRYSRLIGIVVPVLWAAGVGCEAGNAPLPEQTASSSSSSSSSGGDMGPCGMDCSKIDTAQCLVGVCNTGQMPGPLNTCIIVPAPKGTSCDDGKFCTIADACDADGVCVGGGENLCGNKPDPCQTVFCLEDSKTCQTTPSGDGAPCTPKNLCQIDGVCKIGECIGVPKNCAFSPLTECNAVTCDPGTGKCIGTPDPAKDNFSCVLSGDLCSIHKVCQNGECVGGVPKDCTNFNVGCNVGKCDSATGICGPTEAPVGTPCTLGVADCQIGACDDKAECIASQAPDGIVCNDHNSCTKANKCVAGECVGGMPVADCAPYLYSGFETCPDGWTLAGDWECGVPSNVGPMTAHLGTGAMATQIDALYHVNQSYATTVANSAPIDLTNATTPMLSFWAYDHTEGGIFDGWNVKISTNGGTSFAQLGTVSPAYNLTIAGQPAWGGDHSAEGWRNFTADLKSYVGQTAILQFSFRSDGATVFPGVYVDDVIVAEPVMIPLYITTSSALPDIYSGMAYASPIAKIGGTANSVWSIKPNGTNDGWMTIDATTGVLKGTPLPTSVGPVSVTVHVEEPTLPSNYAERTFTFNVKPNAYYTSFEGACPNGWTLTGDWECGVPANVGPATAYVGAQCLATKIAGTYSNLQTYAGTTATSPDIDFTNVSNPQMTFRMWIDTEGATYDGFNLQVSVDGGMTYSAVTGVSPAYPLMIAMQPAWGGHQLAAGWQFVQADLSPYAGKVVRLRFAFQSDSSGVYPGVYIDDIFIN